MGEEHFARVVLLEHAVNILLSLRTHGVVIISNPASFELAGCDIGHRFVSIGRFQITILGKITRK